MGPTKKQPGSYFSKFKWSKIVQFSRWTPPLHGRSPKMQIRTLFNLFNLPSFTPPVRATVGEVRYSIEIDVGGGGGVKGQFYKT